MSWVEDKQALNAGVLREFGELVRHSVGGTGVRYAITAAWSDPTELAAAGIAGTLFADSQLSGFTTQPAKNDVFERGGIDYRVYDLQGPDQTGALYIHLKQ